MNHTAQALKKLRQQKKLTQQDLADLFKTSVQFVCLIENGKSKLPLPMAKLLIKKYKAPIKAALCKDAVNDINSQLEI